MCILKMVCDSIFCLDSDTGHYHFSGIFSHATASPTHTKMEKTEGGETMLI